MSRRCELSGTGPMVGHKVSHSNIKTKRRYEPNLVNVTLASDSLKRGFRLRITAAALRSVDHRGGLDAYLLAAGDEQLQPALFTGLIRPRPRIGEEFENILGKQRAVHPIQLNQNLVETIDDHGRARIDPSLHLGEGVGFA